MRFLLFLLFFTKALTIFLGTRSKKRNPTAYTILLIQTALAFIAESIGLYTGIIKGQNNSWLSNIYIMIELIMITTIAQQLLAKYIKRTQWVYFPLIPITALWIYSISTNGLNNISNWSHTLGSVYTIFLFTLLLYQLSNDGKKIYTVPDFWLSLGLIIFCGATLPLYGLYHYLVQHDVKLMYKLYYINQIAGIIRYSLIAVSFYIIAKPINIQPDVQH